MREVTTVITGVSQTYHELQLVDLRLAREERFVSEELAQDTAAAPHVNSRGLSPGVEQELRSPVPQRHNLRGHWLQWQSVVPGGGQPSVINIISLNTEILRYVPGQSEVRDLNTALVSHQQVGNFQISVDDEG